MKKEVYLSSWYMFSVNTSLQQVFVSTSEKTYFCSRKLLGLETQSPKIFFSFACIIFTGLVEKNASLPFNCISWNFPLILPSLLPFPFNSYLYCWTVIITPLNVSTGIQVLCGNQFSPKSCFTQKLTGGICCFPTDFSDN